jgi:hypothetical protein
MPFDNTGVHIAEYLIAYANNIPTPLYDYEAMDDWLKQRLSEASVTDITDALQKLAKKDYSDKMAHWYSSIRMSDIFVIWAQRDPVAFYEIAKPFLTIRTNDLYQVLIATVQDVPPPQGGALLYDVVAQIDSLDSGDVKDVILALWRMHDEKAGELLRLIYNKYLLNTEMRDFIESDTTRRWELPGD